MLLKRVLPFLILWLGFALSQSDQSTTRPNIIFLLTDDQDLHLESLNYMPLLKKHLLNEGTFYTKHYCTIALCCPARVTLWTGKAAHNTNVTDVNPPYGGYPKFVSQGLNSDYLPVWLQAAGYNTYYVGKLFNALSTTTWNAPFVAGWTGSDFLLDPYTYRYYNATFQRNHDPPVSYGGNYSTGANYSTDVVASKAFGFLDDGVKDGKPFFLGIAPIAPHSEVGEPNATSEFTEPLPAARHKYLFQGVQVPRSQSFNPDMPSGASWVRALPRQNDTNVAYNDHFYRQRLRALQAVDELVDDLFAKLEAYGLLDNTYIIYTADNGYHIGQHRLQPGKTTGYEEDVNVPLVIRGPGVAKNVTTELVTTHTDLSPTILDLIGLSPRPDFDGLAIPIHVTEIQRAKRSSKQKWQEHANVEFWGVGIGEGTYGDNTLNNTYKAVRVLSEEYNLYYAVWCNNEHELYDLSNDQFQLNSLLLPSQAQATLLDYPVSKVASRLDALLLVLKSCKGDSCIEPWLSLHPQGDVSTLTQALNSKYDEFYERQEVKVKYTKCELGYLIGSEGPQFLTDGLIYRDGASWSAWT
ncbi:related to arylsulfatase [Phialocephala subalpina]|uniref:Arylsulfatase n=1 Tax=Phialocephala subalpina TaxID=576137 RepID=A0A1L7XQB7_9HELO|nr:related to arylsulfatase [Phialocephala subalpina]